MRCQNVQHAFTVRDAAARQNLVTEDDFLAVVMQSRTIEKQALLVWLLDGPTAEATRDFLYVLLRVSAIDTERVQLHQLAGIIFIKAAVRPCRFVSLCRIRTRHARSPVVEIKKHCRRVRGRAEQISKTRQRKRPDRFAIESRE